MSDRSNPWRIAFFGSGAFALPTFRRLLAGPDQVVLAVTSPPARSGRGQALKPTPLALAAREAGVPTLETTDIHDADHIEAVELVRPDLLAVAAYRGFLGERLLSLGCTPPLNVHPSLLPRHRGPAPVNWTLIAGDKEFGVSICFTELKIDSGAVLAQRARPTPEGLGAGALEAILAEDGAELLLQVVADIKRDLHCPTPQDESLANMNRLMRKADGRLDFARPAVELARLVNGVDPWPGAQALAGDKPVKFFGAWSGPGGEGAEPGAALGLDDEGRLKIAAGQGLLLIREIQPPGRSRLSAADFLRGYDVGRFASLRSED
ncbi:MAG: methionyl-tRNA formyltransferase [Deltaproteobacteria bacterium]|jgi:methionyl-tRNA formyltransferase|nr:methionyl-tRNA formyltransferase [Deltaproteobacteria bacterium]